MLDASIPNQTHLFNNLIVNIVTSFIFLVKIHQLQFNNINVTFYETYLFDDLIDISDQ